MLPQAKSLDQLWPLLRDGVSTAQAVPAERWQCAAYDGDASIRPDRVRGPNACMLDALPAAPQAWLDNGGNEASWLALDPAQRLTIHSCAQAWQGCTTAGIDNARAAIIVGQIALPSQAASQQALA